MVQSGSKRFDFCRKCINFSPAGGCGSGLHGSEFLHLIRGRVHCLHLLHVLPAHRLLFPVLEAEHQRAGSPARASHTHGLDSDSGFGFGLDWITGTCDIICCHLPSSCCHLPSGGGNLLFFTRILRCSSHFEKQKYGLPTPRRAGSCPGLSRKP